MTGMAAMAVIAGMAVVAGMAVMSVFVRTAVVVFCHVFFLLLFYEKIVISAGFSAGKTSSEGLCFAFGEECIFS